MPVVAVARAMRNGRNAKESMVTANEWRRYMVSSVLRGGLGDPDGLLLRRKVVAAVRRRMSLNVTVSKSC